MPYRVRKPYIIVGGQRLVSPVEPDKRLLFCDKCNTLAAMTASMYTEQAVDKWWHWFSYPKFSCEEEAFMGCESHPVESKSVFLDGRFEPFIRLPLTRWEQATERPALIVAIVVGVAVAIPLAWVFGWLFR